MHAHAMAVNTSKFVLNQRALRDRIDKIKKWATGKKLVRRFMAHHVQTNVVHASDVGWPGSASMILMTSSTGSTFAPAAL